MNKDEYNSSLRCRKFLRGILGDKIYYRMSDEYLLDLERTLEGFFQGISLDESIKSAADMFHVQPEQVTPEMCRLAKEIRMIRNSGGIGDN